MSTSYRFLESILAHHLFDGRLEKFGVTESFSDETTGRARLLTDGRNYLWLYIDDAGLVDCLTRYRPNGAPGKILSAIAEAFNVDIVSEYEPQFWGFATQEEWDAWELKTNEEYDDHFYNEVIKFVHGDPSDINPGTIGMLQANIAKRLTDNDPALLVTENKHKLIAEMDTIYRRDHVISVKLSTQEVAAATMMVTHEDELPRA